MLPSLSCARWRNSQSRYSILSYIEKKVLETLESLLKPGKGEKAKKRISYHQMRRLAQNLAAWRIIFENTLQGTTTLKRDVYYSQVPLFKSQQTSDRIVENMSRGLNVHPRNLHVNPSQRGLVYGSVNWIDLEANTPVCAEDGIKLIPNSYSDLDSQCSSVLVIEKESIFELVCNTTISRDQNCLVITAKGYPDVSTRDFLHDLAFFSNIPIYILTDCDPYGAHIYYCYKYGSKSNLYTPLPSCVWIGSFLQDSKPSSRLPLTSSDRSLASKLLSDQLCIHGSTDCLLSSQLEEMLSSDSKAEIEACISEDLASIKSYLEIRINSSQVSSHQFKRFTIEDCSANPN